MRWILFILILLRGVFDAEALGPHELLLLVNRQSSDSMRVAEFYRQLRDIPVENLVYLEVPEEHRFSISDEAFRELIWDRAEAEMYRRGLDGQILAWVYSTDFPVRIALNPAVSVLGMTFLRGRTPPPSWVQRDGLYQSPLFAGPGPDGSAVYSSKTLDVYQRALGALMPLPAMMLGYTGRQGNQVEEVLAALQQGRDADSTFPEGTVYFVTSSDIRSTCRHWQYPAVQQRLMRQGVSAQITSAFPAGRKDVLGLLVGASDVAPDAVEFHAGAMAEHLTSFAGAFDVPAQSKLSVWVRAGATLSAGAVTEPYAVWQKFPHARFFEHYAAGCTAIESYYQAISSPLQILLIGDPLAQPWKPVVQPALRIVECADAFVLQLHVDGAGHGRRLPQDAFLLDGIVRHEGREWRVRKAELTNPRHRMRAVARYGGVRRFQTHLDAEILRAEAGNWRIEADERVTVHTYEGMSP